MDPLSPRAWCSGRSQDQDAAPCLCPVRGTSHHDTRICREGVPDPEAPREGSVGAPQEGTPGLGRFLEEIGLQPPPLHLPGKRDHAASLCHHLPWGQQLTFPNQPCPISSRYRRLCRPRSVDLSSCTVTGQGAQECQLSFHHHPIFSHLSPKKAACLACSGELPGAPCSLLMGAAIRSRVPASQGSCGPPSHTRACF